VNSSLTAKVRFHARTIHLDRSSAGDPGKLGTRGGLGAVAAESLAVKHQLLIMKRAQRRAPNLTSWDRLVLGVCAFGVTQTSQQDGCDTEAFHPSVLSQRSGEAQVSPAL
jgi:hypothetical protein